MVPEEEPVEVEVHGFINAGLGKAMPYGVYDTGHNPGWVSAGTDHDTARFAVKSIRRWWEEMDEWLYPGAKELIIMADGGNSNGFRCRLWKKCLQDWADEEGRNIPGGHFPPGTSKWNKIEHRMFCHITRNWKGRPLTSHEVIIELIGATPTEKSLRIRAEMGTARHPTPAASKSVMRKWKPLPWSAPNFTENGTV